MESSRPNLFSPYQSMEMEIFGKEFLQLVVVANFLTWKTLSCFFIFLSFHFLFPSFIFSFLYFLFLYITLSFFLAPFSGQFHLLFLALFLYIDILLLESVNVTIKVSNRISLQSLRDISFPRFFNSNLPADIYQAFNDS